MENWLNKLRSMFMKHPVLSNIFVLVIFLICLLCFFMTEPGERILNITLDYVSGAKYVREEEWDRKKIVETTLNHEMIDDVKDIKMKIQKIDKILETNAINEERVIFCGINNVDIGKWELSVTTNNKYDLKLNDKVMIYNKDYSEHVPTAIFFVTAVSSQRKENSPEVYMTEETAEALDIPDANFKGKFSVVMKKLEK